MRLGFHYHVPAIYKDNHIYMPGYLGCFIDSLADYCEEVICFLHSPLPEEISGMDYMIRSARVSLVDIGPHSSVVKRTIQSRKYTSLVRNYGGMDILLVRGPSPLLPAMVTASPVPTSLLLVGDYLKGVNDLPQPRWRKELIRLWSYWNKWGQNQAVQKSLTFVNSRILYEELESKTTHLNEIRTTTLTKEDFFIRSDTCQSRPVRLLYAGRMDRAKGLRQMVEAVSILINKGLDVELDLVGWPEKGDAILDEIQQFSMAKGFDARVHYLGPLSLGHELFDHYKKGDIYLIASLTSEGFPRTIWEAMAHSLPVVATTVGSIPAYVEGAAELVPPGSAVELADGIDRLIRQPELRQMHIARGRELASSNTLEIQVRGMVGKIKEWLEA
jgi:glycosyltransferase involved in cell wall biosynthesis